MAICEYLIASDFVYGTSSLTLPRFRVPPRRVWEREGTKGLLMWLQGRLRSQ
jgi:hypothetical protein